MVPQSEADEYVQIANLGSAAVDLAGWRLADISDGTPEFTFPSHNLSPGGRVRIYTNEDHSEWGGFSFGRGTAIWSNSDPDTAGLFNGQGAQVSTKKATRPVVSETIEYMEALTFRSPMRKLLVILNSMIKHHRCWNPIS